MTRIIAIAAITAVTAGGILWLASARGGVSCADAIPVESVSWDEEEEWGRETVTWGETVTFKGPVTKVSPRREHPEDWAKGSSASFYVRDVRVIIKDWDPPDLWRYHADDPNNLRLRRAVMGKTACVEGTYGGRGGTSGYRWVWTDSSRIKFVDNATPIESP